MADKGFLIQDPIDPLGVTLNMPPPPKQDSNRQLSKKEVEQTRRIAAMRIYVKRKMEQIKNFRILVSSQQQNGVCKQHCANLCSSVKS